MSLQWMNNVIPALLDTYLELQQKTKSLHHDPPLRTQAKPCSCCQSQVLSIWVVQFYKVEKIKLLASACSPVAEQLVRIRLFPCTPVYPSLAVKI
ncbi:hypothetical protein GYMLUDRAFT_161224 [Collybiopsis luxurians FD-317 M1]|nr:hypothetical protein GYMLUDRAFT_161224 [Collybiopsis luxurians FD-317 M1]